MSKLDRKQQYQVTATKARRVSETQWNSLQPDVIVHIGYTQASSSLEAIEQSKPYIIGPYDSIQAVPVEVGNLFTVAKKEKSA